MIVGYARVSTIDQTPQLQIDALKASKCKPIYVEQKSGKNMNRPELTRCLDTLTTDLAMRTSVRRACTKAQHLSIGCPRKECRHGPAMPAPNSEERCWDVG
jgi:predicted site-specific integrase-resolvase